MPFSAGDQLGPYEILSPIGAGGMGEVYKARDTRLSRDVAIKVLPNALASDPDYLARFTREAQVLASLNHPNIAVIYGVEDRALVMELVPGATLQERIEAGPIPLEEALGMARQIADALEAAHEKGVIHRDLKPANVKVTPEGVVKVLDFGLAKAADPVSSASAANSPTLTMRATQAGLIMGTAGYMAPEQAAGKPVDRRADIWSFGVVLYEMLSGKMLFTGETISHTLASVLKDRVDFAIPDVPPAICRLLARCLERNPKERLRDIGEARIAIRDFLSNPAAETEAAKAPVDAVEGKGARRWLARGAFAMVTLALAASLAWNFRPAPSPPVTRFAIPLAEGQNFTAISRGLLALSPDGTQLVYVANQRLYRRSLTELEARPIPGADGGDMSVSDPVFSPDGKSLAYRDWKSGSLKRIALDGGAPLTLCPLPSNLGLSWAEQGIVFSIPGQGIFRVAANGGKPETLIAGKANELMTSPQMLPGGETVLYSVADNMSARGRPFKKGKIIAQNLKTGARKTLAEDAIGARYLPTGHLVYASGGVLFAAPFDPRRLEMTASPVGILEGVRVGNSGAGQYAFSDSGTLVYLPGPVGTGDDGESVLALVDRRGGVERLKLTPAAMGFPRASRDGKRIAYQIDDGKEVAIWLLELAGSSAPRRLTLPGSGNNRFPIWSADGERVAFQSDREGDLGIWWQRADGSAAAVRLTKPSEGVEHFPDSWSPDGRTLSFTEQKKTVSEIWTFSFQDRKATQFAAMPGAWLGRSDFSPDGKWVAYQFNPLGGSSRIYVRPFPTAATAYIAPADGDTHHPVWSPDGKELFYVAGPSQAGSMTFTAKPEVSFGTPVRAPKAGFATLSGVGIRTFDVLPDGKHFIGVVPVGEVGKETQSSQQILVVLNWFEDLKRRMGQ